MPQPEPSAPAVAAARLEGGSPGQVALLAHVTDPRQHADLILRELRRWH